MDSEDSWTPEASFTVSEDDHPAAKPDEKAHARDESRSTNAVPSDGGSIDVAYAPSLKKDNVRRKSVQVVI